MAATARPVDLTNVQEGGNFRPRRKPEGDYRAKFVKADDHQPKDKTKPMGWVLTIQVDGDGRSTYPVYLNPAEKEAWKIGQACRAAGLKVPKGRVRFDPNKLVGKAIGVFLEDDEYEGRLKSTIAEMFPVSEVGANANEDVPDGDEVYDDEDVIDDEPEEEPTPAPRKRRAAPVVEEEVVEDDEEVEEEEEPPPPPKRRRKPVPPPVEEDEEDDEVVEDDEPEPTPPPRKRVAKKTATRRPAPPADDDLDLDDLDD